MNLTKDCSACGRKFESPQDFYSNTTRWRICENSHLWFNCTCGSTNIIRAGKYPWYDPTHRLSEGAKSLFNQIPQLDRFPRLPTHTMELQQMLNDVNIGSQQLAEITKRDPILCALILQIANGKSSARVQKIRSLSHAIAFIGLNQMKEIVLLASLSQIKTDTKVFTKDVFWQNSFLIGGIAEDFALRLDKKTDADMAYISGCLCNIGKLVTALCQPEIADLYCREMESMENPCSWVDVEQRHNGFHHTVVGEIGAMFWGLPEEVSDVIAHHHNFVSNRPNQRQTLIDIVALANQFAHWVTNNPWRMNMDLFEKLLEKFGMTNQQAEQWHDELQKNVVKAS